MLTYNPFYEGTLLFLAILSVVLNIYAFYLIMFKMPSSMRDFRHCLYMLCILDGLFAFVLGVVLNVTFQFPALAGVIKGPIIMFCYSIVGYRGCKIIVCLCFSFIGAIIYCQNYGIKFRFFTIYPNKKYFEYYSSKRGLCFVYGCLIVFPGVIGVAIYVLMYEEQEVFDFILTFPNSTSVFIDFIPGQNLLMAANPKSSAWYFIIAYVTLAIIYTQTTSYGMFIIAMRMLKKYATSFSKQTLQMQRQFLWLLIVQATMPLAFLAIPMLMLVYQVTFQLPMPRWQPEISMIWVGCYSNVNVCLTIFCISPFRKFTRSFTVDLVLKAFGVQNTVAPLVDIQATSSLNFSSRAF